MRAVLLRLLVLTVILVLPAGIARAANVEFPDLQAAVPGATAATYLDLTRQVLPELTLDNGVYRGSEIIATRHLGGADMAAEPPEAFTIFNVAALPARADGRDGLALLFDLGEGVDTAEGFAVLALFELGEKPILLDAAQIGFDRNTYFRDPATVTLNGDNDLLLTMSAHFNSNQGYVTSAMILVRNDRLELVDTVFTFDDRGCGYERIQLPDFGAGGGRLYADIAVTVTETSRRTGETCDGEDLPEEGTRTIGATYRWDDAQSRFAPDSDALKALARENEARF